MSFDPKRWPDIRLVVFDLDGTLYRQRSVRLRMAAALAVHAARGGWRDVRALGRFRALRDAGGWPDGGDFEAWCLATAARASDVTEARLAALVRDWVETRPLPYLLAARYRHVAEVFAGLRRSGRRIAVWSDHPVAAKLAALGLTADDTVAATDADLRRVKPDPTGLRRLIERAGVEPAATLMIGDRADRDGAAALAAGTHVALRSARPVADFTSFAGYDDPLFAAVTA